MESWDSRRPGGRAAPPRGARLRRRGTRDRARAAGRRAAAGAPGPRARLAAGRRRARSRSTTPTASRSAAAPACSPPSTRTSATRSRATEDARLLLVLSPWPGDGHPSQAAVGLTRPSGRPETSHADRRSPISRSTRAGTPAATTPAGGGRGPRPRPRRRPCRRRSRRPGRRSRRRRARRCRRSTIGAALSQPVAARRRDRSGGSRSVSCTRGRDLAAGGRSSIGAAVEQRRSPELTKVPSPIEIR